MWFSFVFWLAIVKLEVIVAYHLLGEGCLEVFLRWHFHDRQMTGEGLGGGWCLSCLTVEYLERGHIVLQFGHL